MLLDKHTSVNGGSNIEKKTQKLISDYVLVKTVFYGGIFQPRDIHSMCMKKCSLKSVQCNGSNTDVHTSYIKQSVNICLWYTQATKNNRLTSVCGIYMIHKTIG